MGDETHEFTTKDLQYLQHGDQPLMLRLFIPAGEGPFPIVVDIHGGAWNTGDLTGCQIREVLPC